MAARELHKITPSGKPTPLKTKDPDDYPTLKLTSFH